MGAGCDNVTGTVTWIKLHDDEFHVVCPVGMLISCRRMRCAWRLAHVSKERDAHKILA